MPHARRTCIALLALLLLTGRAHAQESQARRTADLETKKKAIDVLGTVADQVGTLRSAENRARLGSNIAESLWNHDEPRARRLLDSVQSDINLGLQSVDEDQRTNTETRMVFLKLRIDTIGRIANLDAEAALAFLKATEPEMDLTKSPRLPRRRAIGKSNWQIKSLLRILNWPLNWVAAHSRMVFRMICCNCSDC